MAGFTKKSMDTIVSETRRFGECFLGEVSFDVINDSRKWHKFLRENHTDGCAAMTVSGSIKTGRARKIQRGNDMAKFKVMMTCFDADPSIRPYEDRIARYFSSREEAEQAVKKCVEDELETLNGGEAEGEFIGNFENEQHEAVVEFWEGEPTEGDRDMWPVTIYDIMEVEDA